VTNHAPLSVAVEPAEWAVLTAKWGARPLVELASAVDHPFLSGEHQELVRNGRRAEICYVMHGGDPAQGVLLQSKRYYPDDCYRLPTGGVNSGEAIEETLVREIYEETGLTVGMAATEVRVEAFLGAVHYRLFHRLWGRTADFATYAFLVRMPAGAELDPQDEEEQLAGWRWLPAPELVHIAGALDSLHLRAAEWGDWGRFRAIAHQQVHQWLAARATPASG